MWTELRFPTVSAHDPPVPPRSTVLSRAVADPPRRVSRTGVLRSRRAMAHQGRGDHPQGGDADHRPLQLHVRRPALDAAAVGGRDPDGGRPPGRRARRAVACIRDRHRPALHADISALSSIGHGLAARGAHCRWVPLRRRVSLLRPAAHVHDRAPRLDDDVRDRLRARPMLRVAAGGARSAIRSLDQPAWRRPRRGDDAGAGGGGVGPNVLGEPRSYLQPS